MKPYPFQNGRILLVDDDQDFRETLGSLLSKMGFETTFATNGNEAFDHLCAESFDVIISDIGMPDGDGLELLKRMRLAHLKTPVILLVTGFGEITTQIASEKGAIALFSKPLDLKALDHLIHSLFTVTERPIAHPNELTNAGWSVELRFENEENGVFCLPLTFSGTGMRVVLSHERYPNISDDVSITLVNSRLGHRVAGKGTVRWIHVGDVLKASDGCGLGIEFTYPSEDKWSRLLTLENVGEAKLPA